MKNDPELRITEPPRLRTLAMKRLESIHLSGILLVSWEAPFEARAVKPL